jgi:hypothetical protein
MCKRDLINQQRRARTVIRNGTTQHDPSVHSQPCHHKVQNLPTDVIEINISESCALFVVLVERGALVIERDIDTDFVPEPGAFLGATCDGYNSCAFEFADLAGDGADTACCS